MTVGHWLTVIVSSSSLRSCVYASVSVYVIVVKCLCVCMSLCVLYACFMHCHVCGFVTVCVVLYYCNSYNTAARALSDIYA